MSLRRLLAGAALVLALLSAQLAWDQRRGNLLGVMGPQNSISTSETRNCTAAAGTNWTDPTNALDSDADYALYDAATENPLTLTTCGFALPTGSIITGIVARVVGCGTGTTAIRRRIDVNLLNLGTCTAIADVEQQLCSTAFSNNYCTNAACVDGTPPTTVSTWSCTAATEANVESTSFGVSIVDANATAHPLQIQYVTVTVYYTYSP